MEEDFSFTLKNLDRKIGILGVTRWIQNTIPLTQGYMEFLETSPKITTLLVFSGVTFYDVLTCLKNFGEKQFYVKR